MTIWLRQVRQKMDRHAGAALLLGLAGVITVNWRKWQQDKAFMAAKQPSPPLAPLPNWPKVPSVSVLVAAWNEAENIERHINSFLALRYPHKELILCAGGEDRTYDLAVRHAREDVIVLRQQSGEGKQHALARCLQQSTGEVIFLTDADCLLDDSCFEHTFAPLVFDGEQATTGRFAPLPAQRRQPFALQQWYVDTYWRERTGPYVEGLIGRNAAVTRAAIEETQSFTIAVRTGTDYYLAQQLLQQGVKIRYAHDSMVETEYATSVAAYLRQQSRWLRNVILHGQTFGARRQSRQALAQGLSGLVMVVWPLTLLFTGLVGLVVWLLAMAHGTLARCRYINYSERALKQPRRPVVYLLAPVYFLIDQIMLSYALIEWLMPKLRWRW